MRRPNTDSTPNKPVTIPRNQLTRSRVTSTLSRYAVTIRANVTSVYPPLDCVWNVTAHAQKTDFVFRRNGRVHLNRRGRQFSRLPAAEVCASAVVMLDTPCSEVVWRVLATPLHLPVSPSLPLPCVTVCHHISTGLYMNVERCIPEFRAG